VPPGPGPSRHVLSVFLGGYTHRLTRWPLPFQDSRATTGTTRWDTTGRAGLATCGPTHAGATRSLWPSVRVRSLAGAAPRLCRRPRSCMLTMSAGAQSSRGTFISRGRVAAGGAASELAAGRRGRCRAHMAEGRRPRRRASPGRALSAPAHYWWSRLFVGRECLHSWTSRSDHVANKRGAARPRRQRLVQRACRRVPRPCHRGRPLLRSTSSRDRGRAWEAVPNRPRLGPFSGPWNGPGIGALSPR
jgi:hypothetical protein